MQATPASFVIVSPELIIVTIPPASGLTSVVLSNALEESAFVEFTVT